MGGTKAEGVVLGNENRKEILFRERIPTGAEKGYAHILDQLQKLVSAMEQKVGHRPFRLGIGTPGTHDPLSGTMKGCNSECLNGQTFKQDLASLLGMEIVIANDANCFALAETQMGIVGKTWSPPSRRHDGRSDSELQAASNLTLPFGGRNRNTDRCKR